MIEGQDAISKSLINTECRIYWSSPSTTKLYSALNTDESAATIIFNGYIKRYNISDNNISIEVEDGSQVVLDKNIPSEAHTMELSANVPKSMQGKPIPYVFGYVDKAPLVSDTKFRTLKADIYQDLSYHGLYDAGYGHEQSYLWIRKGNTEVNVDEFNVNGHSQIYIDHLSG